MFVDIALERNRAMNTNIRLASLDVIRRDILPLHINPVPTKPTLRTWFDAAGIPRLKCNPSAKRGGGPCFYSVSAVEKLLRSRMLVTTGRTLPEG